MLKDLNWNSLQHQLASPSAEWQICGNSKCKIFMAYLKHLLFEKCTFALDINLSEVPTFAMDKVLNRTWLTTNIQISCFLCFSETYHCGGCSIDYLWWILCWSKGLARYKILSGLWWIIHSVNSQNWYKSQLSCFSNDQIHHLASSCSLKW